MLRLTLLACVTAVALLVGASTTTPLTVASEPLEAPQAEFTGAVGYGFAVAMSADGSTAMVGQLGQSTFTDVPGVAHVLTFDGANWTEQAELTASDPSYDMLFGNAVAVSADGSTVIVGDPGECGYGLENCEHGVAYVFARSGSTWSQQAELEGGPGFGGAVALSGDGSTALVGAGLSGFYGLSYAPGGNAPPTVFGRSGTTWTQEATLSASDASSPFDNFGHSVALSADGHTALIGDPYRNEYAGSAYVFTGGGSTWTQQAELTAGDTSPNLYFGTSVALSSDGHTALMGAPDPGAGSAYVFTGSGATWTQQAELTPGDAEVTSFDGWFGDAVALDGEGTVALVGAPWAEEDLGAAYAFASDGSTWNQQARFTVADATPYDYFGDAVALSGDGSTALIGRYDPGAYFFAVPAAHVPAPPAGTESQQPIPGAAQATSGAAQATSGAAQASTVSASSGAPKTSGGADAGMARIGGETISPSAFRAARRGASAIVAAPRYGALVTYTLDRASTVRFTVAEVEPGRVASSGRCVAVATALRHARRCRRLVTLPGGFARSAGAGTDRFRFTGRLAGRRLAIGSYRLIAAPTAGGRAGHAVAAAFRIIR
jgi:FG-GAP repeat